MKIRIKTSDVSKAEEVEVDGFHDFFNMVSGPISQETFESVTTVGPKDEAVVEDWISRVASWADAMDNC